MEAAIGIEPMNKGFAVQKDYFVEFAYMLKSAFLLAFLEILYG
jgi:hypothetical protein